MKLKSLFLLVVLASASLAVTTRAQNATGGTGTVTNSIPAINSQTFFASAQQYFTQINTNYTWANVALDISTGYKQVTGVGASSTVDAQYDFAGSRWGAGAAFQFSGIGTPINSAEAAASYAFVESGDLKAQADLRAGYDWNKSAAVAEPGIFLKKKLTANTFAEIGSTLPIYTKGKINRNPTFYIETGFTY